MYFVVLSYPRTGSTVVQRVINTSDNSICIGEKPMTINHLNAFMESLKDARSIIPEMLFPNLRLDDDRNPVFMANAVDTDAVFNYIKAMYVRHILHVVDAPNIGWKENFISSYPDEKIANAEISFIRKMLPDVLFILNIRDPRSCAESALWRRNPESIKEITQRREWMLRGRAGGLFGERAILLDHDEWSNDISALIDPLIDAGINIDKTKAIDVAAERLTHISDI